MTNTRILSAALVSGLLVIGLGACNSESDGGAGAADPAAHDHSAHDHAAHDEGTAPAGDDAHKGMDMGMTLTPVTPSADYPLDTCIVSGEELGGDMGDVIAYEVGGQEIQLCCEGCVDEFKESPEKFLAKIKAASTER